MITDNLIINTSNLVVHQLNNYWPSNEKVELYDYVKQALHDMDVNYSAAVNKRLYNDEGIVFNPCFSITWMIFLYRLSHRLFVDGKQEYADRVYYLNKIMHSNDWYHAIELPEHFLAEHPLGTVLGRAQYGDYFFVYQGCTVGGNRKNGKLNYPKIGKNVIMYANSTILGDCNIGNNVVISANSYLINEEVPDNCIVFGSSPNIVIKKRNEEEIKKMTDHIWKR